MLFDYSILIGGKAGQGSRLGGLIISKLFHQLGYFVYTYEDYQSLIRGGHNFSQIRVSKREVGARKEKNDFILALDEDTILLHKDSLKSGGFLIFNSDKIKYQKGIGIPAENIIKETGGLPVMENIALISAFSRICGFEWEVLKEVLKSQIRKRVELNLTIAKKSFERVKPLLKIKKIKKKVSTTLLTGNSAVALGAIKAGLEFYFAYPMTPSTSILNFLAKNKEKFGIKVVQPEDEISVINMSLGSAFAGRKTALGTSGGGFALMTEGLSLAGQSETPILIFESQRASPSTGVPTYNLQGDLNFVISAGHGDFPRFVIAPGDATQCLYYSYLGLNLAWKYQTPVILLLDKDVSENTFSAQERVLKRVPSIKPILWEKKKEYKRYEITKEGISPLAFPGNKNLVVKNTSYEHNEYGITTEKAEEIKKMQEKRKRKFERMKREVERLKAIEVYGNKNSKTVLFAWGISKGPAREAAENLGIKLIQPIIIEPFPKKQIERALKGVKKIFSVEMNAFGQMAKILNCQGIKINKKILKYTGRPFFAKEIEKEVKEG